ncbi:hypothetical protein A3Q56_07091 [Intoshia linei]|uniref:Uncharacterized protein n=1 Tax=Intoshia linei TaxID=1819745 RepID=A0A177AUZ1_9BILA|nr:hypothetical protein A3Q56_07091 [Intoshia linei]
MGNCIYSMFNLGKPTPSKLPQTTEIFVIENNSTRKKHQDLKLSQSKRIKVYSNFGVFADNNSNKVVSEKIETDVHDITCVY